MTRITILGATGSIGQSTIDLIKRDRAAYSVEALTGGRNIAQLAADARDLNAAVAVTAHDDLLDDLRDALAGTDVQAAAGRQAIIEAGARDADWVMSAIVGAAGLEPGLQVLKRGATLALANKESLVTAGRLVMAQTARHGATLLPVDSEHSAIFQALIGEDIACVEKIQVTASGGAFRDWPLDRLALATPEQAATHPTWSMGQRITIDSASMFNKALELIETHEFFGVSPDRIEALVHPESLIHAIVTYVDGAMMTHIGPHDMRHAIGFALNWPERRALPVPRLDLASIGALTFRPTDDQRYPALALARQVMEQGGLMGAVFNGAKEAALDAFIDGRIGFLDMARCVEDAMNSLHHLGGGTDVMALDDVLAADGAARRAAGDAIARL